MNARELRAVVVIDCSRRSLDDNVKGASCVESDAAVSSSVLLQYATFDRGFRPCPLSCRPFCGHVEQSVGCVCACLSVTE